jgi:hypothetical protein
MGITKDSIFNICFCSQLNYIIIDMICIAFNYLIQNQTTSIPIVARCQLMVDLGCYYLIILFKLIQFKLSENFSDLIQPDQAIGRSQAHQNKII